MKNFTFILTLNFARGIVITNEKTFLAKDKNTGWDKARAWRNEHDTLKINSCYTTSIELVLVRSNDI